MRRRWFGLVARRSLGCSPRTTGPTGTWRWLCQPCGSTASCREVGRPLVPLRRRVQAQLVIEEASQTASEVGDWRVMRRQQKCVRRRLGDGRIRARLCNSNSGVESDGSASLDWLMVAMARGLGHDRRLMAERLCPQQGRLRCRACFRAFPTTWLAFWRSATAGAAWRRQLTGGCSVWQWWGRCPLEARSGCGERRSGRALPSRRHRSWRRSRRRRSATCSTAHQPMPATGPRPRKRTAQALPVALAPLRAPHCRASRQPPAARQGQAFPRPLLAPHPWRWLPTTECCPPS